MSDNRKNKKGFAPIRDVIDKVLRQCRPQHDQALLRVWQIWDQAVGTVIAPHARPVAFNGNVLLIHVSSATWLHHLRFSEREMICKLNAALGGESIRAIKMKVGDF